MVERGGPWHTVRTFDNAHAPEEHHEHRYVGSDRSRETLAFGSHPRFGQQAPVVTYGPVSDAMHAVEGKVLGGWGDIVRSWENTR